MSFFSNFVPIMFLIIGMAFLFKLLDNIFGIGFGTMYTPILLILGLDPTIIVPSILLTEVAAGIIGMIFQALFRNVKLGQKRFFRRINKTKVNDTPFLYQEFSSKTTTQISDSSGSKTTIEFEEDKDEIVIEDESDIYCEEDEELEEIRIQNSSFLDRFRNLTTDSKVIIILIGFGIIGAIISPIFSVIFDYNEYFIFGMEIYIGIMVLVMGIFALIFKDKKINISYRGIIGLGFVGGFNKGISGGGYTPITVVGQMLCGRESKNALASTIFSKTAISLIAGISYVLTHVFQNFNQGITTTWEYLGLTPYLIIGACLAAPIAAFITKVSINKRIKNIIGSITIVLGIFSLIHTILVFTGVWDLLTIFVDLGFNPMFL